MTIGHNEIWWLSVTSLGDFLNFVPTNLRTKVSQIFADLLGYFEKLYFLVKTTVNIFGRYWATFSLPSGHTAWRSQKIENLVSWAESVREREGDDAVQSYAGDLLLGRAVAEEKL